ncbi:MAG: translation initiation factor IF-2 [Buchnera aphidicola (Pentalonia nigronervosa)]|uniref:Translation initiation factor IF-2 n=1 Tax=Buchnera aphidicola (Pentalonia nigronervosa) TaxID=1309793 RepID=A0A7H1AZZ4_9GAMM|nr:MAG: translation initiation factor IF-2 [Buchnera aphidicola (Pentalonia nigronervosa)]
MPDISLKDLSNEVKISIQKLLKKLSDINVIKNENDYISPTEKKFLLKYLNNTKKSISNACVVQRKTRSMLNVSTLHGKNKLVQIEIRKKRTYMKNNTCEIENMSDSNTAVNNLKKKRFLSQKIKHDHNNHTRMSVLQVKHIKTNNINKLNGLKPTYPIKPDIKNCKFKRSTERKKNTLKLQDNTKEKSETWKSTPEEKTNYRLKKFIHKRQLVNLSYPEIDTRKKKHKRSIKNLSQKKNNKYLHKSKLHKEEAYHFSRNKKHSKQKNNSIVLQQVFKKPKVNINRDVVISGTISVSDLSNKMAVKSAEVIKTMMNMGIIGNINYLLDQDAAQLIAEEMGHKVILNNENKLEESIMQNRDIGNSIAVTRPPIVTIMGHVDHGKTSLLDYIRSTRIASNEKGGITQRIGAYHFNTNLGEITFLDTPGHSAFTAMRSRGVHVTDIVILVVAADDGVMPQTIEAIQHAQEANVPIIVAVNKIDKIDLDIDRIKTDLTKQNILSEEWGGENIFVPVSAKTGQGVNQLLNAILLQAEMLELKAISTGMAEGVVIESFLDKGRGPVATVLVKKGTLNKGDVILCGCEYGRVKSLRNDVGHEVKFAKPAIPVEILGLSQVPVSGDIVTVVQNEKQAKEVASYRKNKYREKKFESNNRFNLDKLFENFNKNNVSELKIILKSDVQGSLEAISSALLNLSNSEIEINIISSGIGEISETDVSLSLASNAIILGFNARADWSAKKIIDAENVYFRSYSVIYNLVDEVKSVMTNILSPKYKQSAIGSAIVRTVFKSPKFDVIAGCMVTDGIIKRNKIIHVLRGDIVIYKGELESLRRFKEDVYEVRHGMECGIIIKDYNDICVSDVIEVFEMKNIKRVL